MINEGLLKAFVDINAACTRASVRAAGMQASNMKCVVQHKLPPYLEEDFLKLIEEEGIGYNDVMSKIFDR